MPKDYYLILGVTRDASPGQLKGAWRRLAREFHPDRSGGDAGPFLELQEAWSVLGDPSRRVAYDRDLEQRSVFRPESVPAGSPWAVEPEPLIPDERRLAAIPIGRQRVAPVDGLLDRLWHGFVSTEALGRVRLNDVDVRVALSAEQARRGGPVRILVPVRSTCPTCRGRGGVGMHGCWRCAGEGALDRELPLVLAVPPGVPDGHVVRLVLDRNGIEVSVRFEVVEPG